MKLTKRTFLKTCSLGVVATACGGLSSSGSNAEPPCVRAAGLAGWAEALALARGRVRNRLLVHEAELLAGWRDSDRIQIVETGCVEDGKWRLLTRGFCMELMLRMEIMGPIASTPHPRPGEPWMPILQVGALRRLMMRMLVESRVDVAFDVVEAEPFVAKGMCVSGRNIVSGQKTGIERALAFRLGVRRESLDPKLVQRQVAREMSLPG